MWYGPMNGIVPRGASDSLPQAWLSLMPELPRPGFPSHLQPRRYVVSWRLYLSLITALNAAALGFGRLPADNRAALLRGEF